MRKKIENFILHLRTKSIANGPNKIHKLLTEMDLQNLNIARKATATSANNKFAQKWLTVVYVNSFVNYLVQCGTTLVLQVMPFLHKFSNRYKAF